ncbi:MAG: MBL fold metallo-hydrolase [Desulfarculaceae bacterium]|jgi:7,8-dihydropterin-6-yl-methyl-4-(beta-D-ribofuranosyl)aminobenzene 5'-phosphate synthase
MTKLIVVSDNEVHLPGLAVEHGLAIWVEAPWGAILYDTGQGQTLLPNLERLQLDPVRLQGVVISHGHYDHIGGLAALLRVRQQQGKKTPVWCHQAVFTPHLKQADNEISDVGPPQGPGSAYTALGAEFHWVEGQADPWPGVTLMAPIPRRTSFEGPAPNLVTRQGEGLISDPFEDDLAMLLAGPQGPVVVTGCAHAGVINVLMHAESIAGQPPVLLVGGTHLGPAPAAQQEAALAELASREDLQVAVGHCTGKEMAVRMGRILGQRFWGLGAGRVMEI